MYFVCVWLTMRRKTHTDWKIGGEKSGMKTLFLLWGMAPEMRLCKGFSTLSYPLILVFLISGGDDSDGG